MPRCSHQHQQIIAALGCSYQQAAHLTQNELHPTKATGEPKKNVTNATETSDPVAVFVEEPTRMRPEERLGTSSNLRSLQGSVRNQSLVTSSGFNHWKTHPEHTNWDHHPVGVMD